jgi:hypothetical protein
VNWWRAAVPSEAHSFRWYSVTLGPKILVLLLDSDSSLKPGSEQRTWFEQQMTNPSKGQRREGNCALTWWRKRGMAT